MNSPAPLSHLQNKKENSETKAEEIIPTQQVSMCPTP